MKAVRLLAALCAALLLAACSDDLLPPTPDNVAGLWRSISERDPGPNERTVQESLSLQEDGRFVWSETTYGDGAGHPDLPISQSARFGQYRLRGGFLEIRTEATEFRAPLTATPQRTVVERPQWSGDQYRIQVDENLMRLRFTVAPADAPVEVTRIFWRDIFPPID